MSYTYDGLATVAVLALYAGQPPNNLTTLKVHVRVRNAAQGRFRLEFDPYLQGPKEANALRVMQHGCRLLQGPIIDGCNEPAGGRRLATDRRRATRAAARTTGQPQRLTVGLSKRVKGIEPSLSAWEAAGLTDPSIVELRAVTTPN